MSTTRYATAALLATVALAGSTTEPTEFTANPDVGPGGNTFTDSPHFRVYDSTGTKANTTLQMLESAYTCFVHDLGWRSSGLSYNSASDTASTWYKENIYAVDSIDGGAAGVMLSDASTGLSYVQVVSADLDTASVTVHEYGHALTYHTRKWVEQTPTGAWWETLAEWFSDTFQNSDLCAAAREAYGQESGTSIISLGTVIGESHRVIVDGSADGGNYYEAWPLLSYLTANPDNYTGLGDDAVLQLNLQYDVGSGETPLHTLERLLGNETSVAAVAGRYWARMAYVDIGNDAAHRAFLEQRDTLSYGNLEGGEGSYTVKSARKPLYFGANINPITISGEGGVAVNVTSGLAFTATLAIWNTGSGSVRYVDLENGSGEATVGESEEASLVVVNTPDELIQYDPFDLTSAVKVGLDYTVKITGASL
ncbi:hypothetical protein BJX76DRAFT_369073 [Aspergillus varians]